MVIRGCFRSGLFVVAFACTCATGAFGGESLRLVENGACRFAVVGRFKAEAAIRGPGDESLAKFRRASVGSAADTLCQSFAKCCGSRPARLEEDDPKVADYPCVIAVGPTKWSEKLGIDPAKLPREGFEIRTFGKGVVIVGHDWTSDDTYDQHNWRCGRLTCNGTLWGAEEFVERVLNVRVFCRADEGLWTDYPKAADVTVAPFSFADAPQYWFRRGGGWRSATSTDCFGGEAPAPAELAKAHPDLLDELFYRDSHGKLWCDPAVYSKNFLDVTGTKLADVLVEDFKKYYAQDGKGTYWRPAHAPSSRYLWFGQCDRGMDMDTPRAKLHLRANPDNCDRTSEIYGHFYDYFARQCAQELPGKTVVLMGYSSYLRAPRTISRFPDNVQILCCIGQPALAWSEPYMKEVVETYEGWNALCAPDKKCVPYLYVMENGIPDVVHGYCMGEFLRRVEGKVDPHNLYPCFGSTFALKQPLGGYLLHRAYWNPNHDRDADLRDFCVRLFGEASGEKMIDLYQFIFKRWREGYIPRVAKGKYLGHRLRSIAHVEFDCFYKEMLDPASLDVLVKTLDEAEALLGDDPLRHRRFDRIAKELRKTFADARAFQRLRYPAFTVGRQPTKLPPFGEAFLGDPLKGPAPEATLRWDEQGLTLTFRSPAPYVHGKNNGRHGGLFGGDNFEFFLLSGNPGKNLYQFIGASNGEFGDYHQSIDPPRGKDARWTAQGATYRAEADAKGWTGTLFIPWKALYDEPPKKGDVWKVNLVSNRTTPAENASISPTFGNNSFHTMYATMTFGD